ncbi:MAG TPA: hypothetical protein VFZ34_06325 [Blastocatellia bacterium]|nr:hypothetical protein [Blastocatellia bacterium]
MVAERIQFGSLPQTRSQTLLALFAHEEKAEEFVARLNSLGFEPGTPTIIGVALGEPPKRLPLPPHLKAPHTTRFTLIGVAFGGFLALLLSLILYRIDFLHLSLLEAMLIHTFALMILGGVIGGAAGAIYASIQAQKMMTTLPPQSTDGALVTLRVAVHLVPQCEAIAREMGAQKVIV